MSMTETINHPSHYGGAGNPYEAIKVIDAWGCNFNTGNAYKYMARAGFKIAPGQTLKEKRLEDYRKARWYLQHQFDTLKEDLGTRTEPRDVSSAYDFTAVFIEVGFAATLRDAVRACFYPYSAKYLRDGITALTELIEGLKI